MNRETLLQFVPESLHSYALAIFNWFDESIDRTMLFLSAAITVYVGLLLLGVGVGWVGFYWTHSLTWVLVGHSLIAASAALGSALYVMTLLRISVLTEAVTAGSNILAELAKQLSRPLPGDPVQIPALKQETATQFLRIVSVILAFAMTFSGLAMFLPVYTGMSYFIAACVGGVIIGLTTFGYSYHPKWAPRYLYAIGVLMFLVSVVGMFNPAAFFLMKAETFYRQQEGMLQANAITDVRAVQLEQKQGLYSEWTAIQSKTVKGLPLTEEETNRYQWLRDRFEAINEPIDKPFQDKTSSFSAGVSIPDSIPDPPMYSVKTMTYGILISIIGFVVLVMSFSGEKKKEEKK